MNCSKCTQRYTKNNKPLSLPCGHTYCSRCLGQTLQKCFKCFEQGAPKLNQALYELVLQDRHCQIDKFVKVCFFGETAVGKTSVINRLAEQKFNQLCVTTVGLDFRYKDKQVKDKNIRFQLWDSAGQQQFRAITPNHYRNADIVVLVYSLIVSESQNDIAYWINEIKKYTLTSNVIVLGNKADLVDEDNQEKGLSKNDISELNAINWKILQVSCKTNQNFDKIWEFLMEAGYNLKKQQKNSSILENKESRIKNLAKSSNGLKNQEKNTVKIRENLVRKEMQLVDSDQSFKCCIIM